MSPAGAHGRGTRARFLVNVRTSTMAPAFVDRLRPAGFLVAPAYLTAATRVAATRAAARRPVLVDNGLFDDVGQIASDLGATAAGVLAGLTDRSGGSIDAKDALATHLSPGSRHEVASLVRQVADRARAARAGLDLPGQRAVRPRGVIGAEDITAATLLRLGVEVDLVPGGRARLRRMNEAVAQHAIDDAAALASRAPGDRPGLRAFPVASAHDYDTAVDAGRTFAAAGLDAAAMGFGAFMADDTYTRQVKLRGRRRDLVANLPARYVRTALVARGFWDGWAEQTGGGAPSAFHFLGLGAPIMLGVVALAGHATPELTYDATSPIRDAVEGALYLDDPAPLKSRTRRVAALLMDQPGYRWRCRCPFCTRYLASHPFDMSAAASWRGRHPHRPIQAIDLRPPSTLATALPLLAEPRGGPERAAVDVARSGHNHWVLQRICRAIAAHGATRGQLAGWLDDVVTAYEQTTNADSFAAAVRTGLVIAETGDLPRPGR